MDRGDLAALLKPGATLRACADGVDSVLPEEAAPGGYDRIARGYDWIVGNPLYNRLAWNASPRAYADAARDALAGAPEGPALDCGGGSLVFTRRPYRDAARGDLIVLDRSLAMLRRAHRRWREGCFVQGDALDLPFADARFGLTMAWGMLHLFGTRSALLPELARVTRRGGSVWMSTLVRGATRSGDRMLAMLHRNGEAAAPETELAVTDAFRAYFRLTRRRRAGAMLILEGWRA